jgi:AraC-like DNA-binding protein
MTEDLVRPTIPIAYLAEMAARARGGDVRASLAAAGLPVRALASRRLRVSIAQLARFHASLVRAGDDEMFGFLARPVPRGGYAMLVRLLTGAGDLAAVLDAASRFYGLFEKRSLLALAISGATATLSLDARAGRQARSVFFAQSMLLSAWRTGAWLVGRPMPLDAVVLPRRFTRYRGETRYLFGREPAFDDGPPRIVFRAAMAKLPVVKRPDEADAWSATALQAIVLAPPRASLESELRAVLAAEDLSLDDAARRVGLSRASLARELARLGTTFLRVKDDLRRDHAIALLAETTLDLDAIGRRLGYSGSRAFQRAFRQWTGATAGAFRGRRARV